MNLFYRFARTVYSELPLSLRVKDKIKAAVFFFIPSWKHNPRYSNGNPVPAESPEIYPIIERKAKLLSYITPVSQEGLEIGPLFSPIVTKAESAGHVWYVDYTTADVLKEKYRNDPNVRVDEIVETDYLWGEASLPELVNGKQYDYVIASHVIEHVPDMLGWLVEIGEVLKDKGILSLAVPDKRYSFDYLRELSTPGMLIEAYLVHRRRPGPREVFDHFSLASKLDVTVAWAGNVDKSKLTRYHDFDQAFELAKDSFHTDHYHDAHVNTFTPASFLDLLETAARLNLFDFVVIDFYNTARNNLEFFISLERLSRNENRQAGLQRQLEQLAWARERINNL